MSARQGANHLTDRIAAARFEANLSQGELADALGVSKRTIQLWEAGRTTPRPSQRRKLVEWLAGMNEDAA